MSDGQESSDDRPHVLRRVHTKLHANRVTGAVTKIVITTVGVVVIAVGIFLSGPGIPGPGFLVILGGLAILATEWEWADRILHWAKEKYEDAKQHVTEMDPRVRRRRLLLTVLAVVVVVGAATAYVVVYDWPGFAVSGWDWLQDLSGVLPELPGM